jgi:parvulin-like peptidyl-prolyl isomerase
MKRSLQSLSLVVIVSGLGAGACGPGAPVDKPPSAPENEKIKSKHEALSKISGGKLGPAPDGIPTPHTAGHGGAALSRSRIATLAKDAFVLKVDDQLFTKGDLDRTMTQSAALAGVPPEMLEGEMRDAFEAPAYEKLIERYLLGAEAKRRNLWPTDEEAKKSIADMVATLPKGKTLNDVLATIGTDEATFNKDVVADVAIGKLLKAMEAAMTPPPKELVNKIYGENKQVFVVPDMTSAQHILIKAKKTDGPDVIAEREKLARDIKALVVGKDAANFAKVAQEKSEDGATKARGGDLGTFKRGDIFPEIEALAFTLKEGEIGGPVLTDRGFHVVRGGGAVKGHPVPEKEAKEIIADREKVKAFMAQVDGMTAALRKGAKIERLVEPLPSPLVDPEDKGSKVPTWKANAESAKPGMQNPH